MVGGVGGGSWFCVVGWIFEGWDEMGWREVFGLSFVGFEVSEAPKGCAKKVEGAWKGREAC